MLKGLLQKLKKVKLLYYLPKLYLKIKELQKHPEKLKSKKFIKGSIELLLAILATVGVISEDFRELILNLIMQIVNSL